MFSMIKTLIVLGGFVLLLPATIALRDEEKLEYYCQQSCLLNCTSFNDTKNHMNCMHVHSSVCDCSTGKPLPGILDTWGIAVLTIIFIIGIVAFCGFCCYACVVFSVFNKRPNGYEEAEQN